MILLLRKEGYRIHAVNTYTSLLDVATRNINLILLNVYTANVDLHTIYNKLKNNIGTHTIPVVFTGELSMLQPFVTAYQLNTLDYHPIPSTDEDLLSRIRFHYEREHIQKEIPHIKASTNILEVTLAWDSLNIILKNAAEAKDWSLVSRILEPNALTLTYHSQQIRKWLLGLPSEAFIADAMLKFWKTYTLVGLGRLTEAESSLDTQLLMQHNPVDSLKSSVSTENNTVNPLISYRYSGILIKIAEYRGDGQEAVKLALQGPGLVVEGHKLQPFFKHQWLGTSYCADGLPRKAEVQFIKSSQILDSIDVLENWLKPFVTCWYARTLFMQGRLIESLAICRQAISMERRYESPTVDLCYAFQAEILLSQNQIEQARESIGKALQIDGPFEQWHSIPLSWLIVAQVYYALEDENAAERVIANLIEWSRRNNALIIKNKAESIRTDYWLRKGYTEKAWLWAKERQFTGDNVVSYENERINLTLARLYLQNAITNGNTEYLDNAIEISEKVQKVSLDNGRIIDYSTALLIHSLVLDRKGDQQDAFNLLEKCLSMAVPEGAFRIFINEGEPMYNLLIKANQAGLLRDTTNHLLSLFRSDAVYRKPSAKSETLIFHTTDKSMTVSLTKRELELLKLIAAGHSSDELMEKLYISNNTVKTHIKHLYRKLNVSTRTQAIVRARNIGLLS